MSKDYESSEFYSCKFKNFATIIIIPAAILVLLIIISSFFVKRQNKISSVGVVEPRSTINTKLMSYHEGQVISKGRRVKIDSLQTVKLRQDRVVHIDESKQVTNLFPKIRENTTVRVMTYLPGNEISAVKNRQKFNFIIAGSEGKNINLTGRVKRVNVYPTTIRSQSMYQVLADVKVKDPSSIRYGMQGNATIITGEMTYFEYFKDKILNQK